MRTRNLVSLVVMSLALALPALAQENGTDPIGDFLGSIGWVGVAVLGVFLYFFARWGGFRLLY